MGLDDLLGKAKDLAGQHGDKIEGGLDKAAEFAKGKFGHEEQIDGVVDKAKGFLGEDKGGDQQQ